VTSYKDLPKTMELGDINMKPSKKFLDALCKLYEKDCSRCSYEGYCKSIGRISK
jgi:hypothetical protein